MAQTLQGILADLADLVDLTDLTDLAGSMSSLRFDLSKVSKRASVESELEAFESILAVFVIA